jgi:hypothetical protein
MANGERPPSVLKRIERFLTTGLGKKKKKAPVIKRSEGVRRGIQEAAKAGRKRPRRTTIEPGKQPRTTGVPVRKTMGQSAEVFADTEAATRPKPSTKKKKRGRKNR